MLIVDMILIGGLITGIIGIVILSIIEEYYARKNFIDKISAHVDIETKIKCMIIDASSEVKQEEQS